MTQTSMTTAGIDTSKSKLDIAVHGRAEQLAGRQYVARLAELDRQAGRRPASARVGIEATGGYERGVVEHLRAAGFTVLVLQPVQVKAFGRVHLRRAKNDALDAVLIAACTAALDQVRDAPDPRLAELARASDLPRADRGGHQALQDPARAYRRTTACGAWLLGEIARLKARRLAQIRHIAKQLRAHHDLAARLDLVLSIPGIGERTALAILIRMPELGRISREEAAALAGLAPFDNDSGQQRGQRRIAGGRARLRRSLFAAALPAAFRWNRALIALYARLTAAGKAHNAALIACARKLLIYANTVVQRGTPWTEKPLSV